MPITIVAEDGSGNPDANSYIDATYADTYHADRGNAYWDALGGDAKSACLIKATDYIDKRFTNRFRGFRMQKDQALAWPRLSAFDDDEFTLDGVPVRLQKATAEYALRAAIYNVLAPDPIRTTPGQNMSAATFAEAILLFSGNAIDGQTVTIGTTVYTFESGSLDVAYEVLLGADVEESIDNLLAAINGSGTPGVEYATGTVAHPNVVAGLGAGDSLIVVAKIAGSVGNSIATTDTLTNATWSAGTLTGGDTVSPNEDTTNITVGPVKSKSVKVGPIEKSTTYEGVGQLTQANSVSSRASQSVILNDIYVPQYPEADMLIEALLDIGGTTRLERA